MRMTLIFTGQLLHTNGVTVSSREQGGPALSMTALIMSLLDRHVPASHALFFFENGGVLAKRSPCFGIDAKLGPDWPAIRYWNRNESSSASLQVPRPPGL
jgi:hypothetical protein